MSITVLFDLDETLLKTNLHKFLPAYFQSLGNVLSDLGSHEQIANQLHYAISQMIANKSPEKLLNQIFAENFYNPLGTTESAFLETISHYYRESFPTLQTTTQTVPDAVRLVEWCRSQNMTLALATNPLFPKTSIRQRIQWSGINPADFNFYTNYDNCHFAKPNLEYYAEIMGHLGWLNQQTVMIGDNFKDDIQPAKKMGFKTFWIDPASDDTTECGGDLSQVRSWLEDVMKNQDGLQLPSDPQISLAILRSTPAVIDTWHTQVNKEINSHPPSNLAGDFAEILWRMADFETEVARPQWEQLLLNPNRALPPINTGDRTTLRQGQSHTLTEGFQKFFDARLASLRMIQSLQDRGLLDFSGNRAILDQENIHNLMATIAKQDRIHLQWGRNLLNNYKIY